jgi:hypothetical protein
MGMIANTISDAENQNPSPYESLLTKRAGVLVFYSALARVQIARRARCYRTVPCLSKMDNKWKKKGKI